MGHDRAGLSEGEGRSARRAAQAGKKRERLTNDLIHIVVPVGREPTNEVHVRRLLCELQITPVQSGVGWPRHGIIRIPGVSRKFVDDAGERMLLPREVFEFGYPRELIF